MKAHTEVAIDRLARSVMTDVCVFALSWSTEAANTPAKYQAAFDKMEQIIRALITRQHPDMTPLFPRDVEVRKENGAVFYVDPKNLPGSPSIGRGVTLDAALGDFLRAYQEEFGLNLTITDTALPAELARRRRQLAQR